MRYYNYSNIFGLIDIMSSIKKTVKINGKMYNKTLLSVDNTKTLIIVDWDDTLYPTSWTIGNQIDLTSPDARLKYTKYFRTLDSCLSSTLKKMKQYGDVLIVTNAMLEWVKLTLTFLPKTKHILEDVEIVSARSRYQNTYQMSEWKKMTFMDEINKRAKSKSYTNLLSLGDAEYEHIALINLYKTKTIPYKYLKSIKFIKSTEISVLLEQLELIHSSIEEVCKSPRHMDLRFDTIK
jgi:hypothetical protein